MLPTAQTSKNSFLFLIVANLLAAVTAAVGLLNWFAIKSLVDNLLVHSTINKWSWSAIDNFSFLLLGIFWLVVVFLCQHHYVNGVKKKRLWSCFSLYTGIQLLFFFACQAIPVLVGINPVNLAHLLIDGLLFAAGAAFVILSRRRVR